MKAKDFRTDRRRAFLLADLLTAILLFSLAALFLFFPIKGYARIFYEERDRFAAEQRAASAVSKIRFAALYSGLGMRNGEEYKNAFFPNSGQPFTWSGPAAASLKGRQKLNKAAGGGESSQASGSFFQSS